ncbi:hypothetical protein B0H19DRAFT_1263021 [Mycena capillaripes]|nr:hypothetical protein B0H19DRAFT_1263021 [Mycena capillaripes]
MPPFSMDDTYGAMLIGDAPGSFQGVLTVQAYVYYESYSADSRKLKWLVAVIWVIDLVHLILICHTVYHYLITSWGNDAALLVSTQDGDLHLTFVGAATLLCQAFFLHRVWIFSKHNWLLTGILGLACLTTMALEIVMTVQISRNKSVAAFSSVGQEVITMFSLGAAVDIIIAFLLVWYLQQGQTSFEKTSFVLTRIIQYTVATGLATSLLALGCVAAYVIKPQSFVFIAMHFSLGRMYTNALLATYAVLLHLQNLI